MEKSQPFGLIYVETDKYEYSKDIPFSGFLFVEKKQLTMG